MVRMNVLEYLAAARDIIAAQTTCFAITVAESGWANARIVQPSRLREDWSVRFRTDRRCRKFSEIERSKKLTLAYKYDVDAAYVTLLGKPQVLDDVAFKRSIWQPAFNTHSPGGPDDPNVVFIKLRVDRIELYCGAKHIEPLPVGLNAVVLVRGASDWEYSTSTDAAAFSK
jgi:general stress protein 26